MSASTPTERQRLERLAAAIGRAVDAAPALSAEQVGQLRGMLPYPYSGASSGDREATSA
ncbi:MAG TPA: hypothetical protein VGL46_16950 [Pseudonocardiaceae bacterium]